MRTALQLLFLTIMTYGCDNCSTIDCENGGECVDGICQCTQWFEGESCEIKVLEKYEGIYDGLYDCGNTSDGHAKFTDISERQNEMTVLESSGRTYDVEFDDANNFTIGNQTIADPGGGTVTVSGNGAITSASVDFDINYQYTTQASNTTICLFSGTKD